VEGGFLENKKRGCLENGKTDGPSAAIFKQSYAERETQEKKPMEHLN
jgi:hypothetical protein